VPRITFHQLRHTAAALMLEAGADLKYVQYVLGHGDMFITARIYAHVTARLDRLRSAQVDGLIPRKRKRSDDEPDEDRAATAA
jgi:site-specific recombinase XerD